MPLLFVYGTLQDETLQQHVFGRALEVRAEVLAGYRLSEVRSPTRWWPHASAAPVTLELRMQDYVAHHLRQVLGDEWERTARPA